MYISGLDHFLFEQFGEETDMETSVVVFLNKAKALNDKLFQKGCF